MSDKPSLDSTTLALGDAKVGVRGRIVALEAGRVPPGGLPAAELERRLLELGFVEGASVEVLHEGPIGRDPIAVRVADATIALRRHEALAVMIAPEGRQ